MAACEILSYFFDGEELFNAEGIFDLRAEYAALHINLARMAEERGCILALSIDPHTPRFFVGDPVPFRELLIALVDRCFDNAGVDIVNVRLGSIGTSATGRHHLEITVATNGISMPPRQMELFDLRPKHPKVRSSWGQEDPNALFRINNLINRFNGSLRIDDVYGWGPRYVARLQLTKLAAGTRA
ncbi:MAG: hypothetical protein OEV91_01945 [Desulfobulbaceae bacterium]|nr:hypothetical protein [Desulfobulbaceae bacterium]